MYPFPRHLAVVALCALVAACAADEPEGALSVPQPAAAVAAADTDDLEPPDTGFRRDKIAAAIERLTLKERQLGTNHPGVAGPLNRLASLYALEGVHDKAEALARRAVEINRNVERGPRLLALAVSLNLLGQTLQARARYAEAEPLFVRALRIQERELGLNHRAVGRTLIHLASVQRKSGRPTQAESLLRRALTILEGDSDDESRALTALGETLADLHRTGEAIAATERALRLIEASRDPDHPRRAGQLVLLAGLYLQEERLDSALRTVGEAIAVYRRTYGEGFPPLGRALLLEGRILIAAGRSGEAEARIAAAERAFAAFPAEHPALIRVHGSRGRALKEQGREAEALESFRRLANVYRGRAATTTDRTAGREDRQLFRGLLFAAVDTAWSLSRQPGQEPTMADEALGFAQLAQGSAAGVAIARMATRLAAGESALADAVRARQDAIERWQTLDSRLTEATASRPEERDREVESEMRREMAALDRKIRQADEVLARNFPRYNELANPAPLAVAEVQRLLTPDEAVLVYLVGGKHTFLWVVRPRAAELRRLDIGAARLAAIVKTLRNGLDLRNVRSSDDLPRFDAALAFDLYRAILAPAEQTLAEAKHVFVVADGPLRALPLHLLPTWMPPEIGGAPAAYRRVPWLARTRALTTLPSLSALRALRDFAAGSGARQPFAGFGDPLLEGSAAGGAGPAAQRQAGDRRRGGETPVPATVRALPPLPDTAEELKAIAGILRAPPDSLFLRERATESAVKAGRLADARVVAFATHGVLQGELAGLAEPALVLTPPAEPGEADDGLLSASEVALLRLDAEWVILSACNTGAAAGEEVEEDGLAGLARAFFHAGSRTLLVSHWPVLSEAATALTTRMLAEATRPGTGRAEALRRAMVAVMDTVGKPHFAHPAAWAPFVVVGEGGAGGR